MRCHSVSGAALLALFAVSSLASADSMLHARVAPQHFNRLAFDDVRIASVHSEARDCHVQSDEAGSVYVMPLSLESFRLFLTTEKGKTHLVELHPTATRAQNVTLTVKVPATEVAMKKPTAKSPSMASVARGLLQGRVPPELIATQGERRVFNHGAIRVTPQKRYQSAQGDYIIADVQNRQPRPMALTDWSWLPDDIVGVETHRRQLAGKSSTMAVLIVKGAKDDNR